MRTIAEDVTSSVDQAHKTWGWYLVMGIALVLVGIYAIWSGTAATLASIVVLGAVLFIAGIFQLGAALVARGAGHVILALLAGALDIVVGIMLMEHPDAGALTVTLLLAALFVAGGIIRFFSALYLQFPQYGWVAFSGAMSFVLGILLWIQWPVSAAWFIGFIVGLNFIFAGISWSALALKLKSV